MEFEHSVQVNDLQDDSMVALSRSELWQGLLLRARHPEKFNPALICQLRPVASNEFLRTITVGETKFLEHVVLQPEEYIHTSTVPDINQIAAESEAFIEEPKAGGLIVRFRYKREVENDVDMVDVAEHLKSAYLQLDRDAIAMIRALAESESFE